MSFDKKQNVILVPNCETIMSSLIIKKNKEKII
jgi:hypothetical protein